VVVVLLAAESILKPLAIECGLTIEAPADRTELRFSTPLNLW
jgi:hypothetical protein